MVYCRKFFVRTKPAIYKLADKVVEVFDCVEALISWMFDIAWPFPRCRCVPMPISYGGTSLTPLNPIAPEIPKLSPNPVPESCRAAGSRSWCLGESNPADYHTKSKTL